MLDIGKPIRIFYANLLYMKVILYVENGTLHAKGPGLKNLSPAGRAEIARRKEQLIEMLGNPVPPELQSYFGRLLTLTELESAYEIAKFYGQEVDPFPANGGWVLLMKGVTDE